MNRNKAIKMLGENAFHSVTNTVLHSRVDKLLDFHERHKGVEVEDIYIEVNNNWSRCPSPKTAKHSCLLGGVMYQYQVWAVIR